MNGLSLVVSTRLVRMLPEASLKNRDNTEIGEHSLPLPALPARPRVCWFQAGLFVGATMSGCPATGCPACLIIVNGANCRLPAITIPLNIKLPCLMSSVLNFF